MIVEQANRVPWVRELEYSGIVTGEGEGKAAALHLVENLDSVRLTVESTADFRRHTISVVLDLETAKRLQNDLTAYLEKISSRALGGASR